MIMKAIVVLVTVMMTNDDMIMIMIDYDHHLDSNSGVMVGMVMMKNDDEDVSKFCVLVTWV